MKQTKIDLSEPFEDVLARLLTLPSTLTEIDEVRFPSADDSELRKSPNCVAEVKEALRSLYEAAHGRQVETPIGFLPIAPPVAAFLKKKPYYVATQYEFFLEAFTRILVNRNTSVSTKKTNNMNNENDIIVTAPDHAELTSVITVSSKVSERAKWELGALKNELKRARIMRPEEVPSDVITMNTRAEFLDLESGERMEFTLVLPADAKIDDGKISVLAPLGTAMLGYRVGDTFEWPVPYGIRRLKVLKVHFQSEESLQQAA